MLIVSVQGHVYRGVYSALRVFDLVFHGGYDDKGGNRSGEDADGKDGSEEGYTSDFKFLVGPFGEVSPPGVAGGAAFLEDHTEYENQISNEEGSSNCHIRPN